MRLLTTLCVISLAAAGAAQASQRMSDLEYIRANRCIGLAMGGGQDATPFETLVQENRQGRRDATLTTARLARKNAQSQMQRAGGSSRERLNSELSQDCAAMIS